MRNKYDNPLAGLIDEKTQWLFNPFIASTFQLPGGTGIEGSLFYRIDEKKFVSGYSYIQNNYILADKNNSVFYGTNTSLLTKLENMSPMMLGCDNSDFSLEFIFYCRTTPVNNTAFMGSLESTFGIYCAYESSKLTFGYRNNTTSSYASLSSFSPIVGNFYYVYLDFTNSTGLLNIFVNNVDVKVSSTGTVRPNMGVHPGNQFQIFALGTGFIGVYKNTWAQIGDVRLSNVKRTSQERKAFCNNAIASRINNFSI